MVGERDGVRERQDSTGAAVTRLVPPPSWPADPLGPQGSCWRGVHRDTGTQSCHSTLATGASTSPSLSPPETYGAVDFPSSGILQRSDLQPDTSPGEICQGEATGVALASQGWDAQGWGSPPCQHRHPPALGSGQKSPPATRQCWSVKAGGQVQVGAQVMGCRWQRPPLLQ